MSEQYGSRDQCEQCGSITRGVRIVLLVIDDDDHVWVCPECRERLDGKKDEMKGGE